ncbi:MAG: hypothetical protein ACR2ND_04670 [Solirubrobacteraceae bacterium]
MIVDTGALLRLLYTSLLAGVGTTVIFSLAVYGATRAADMRRARRPQAAAVYLGVAAFSLLATLGAVLYGLVLVAQKR